MDVDPYKVQGVKVSEIKDTKCVKSVEDRDLEKIAGGINNIEQLKTYIREQKLAGKDLNQIYRVVLCMPANLDYLDVTYDENGKPVSAEGVYELMVFTEEYYNSITLPEPEIVLEAE